MSRRKAGPYRNGKVHVQSKMCATCIFRPGNLMRLEEGRVEQMVRDATRMEGQIPCHETILTGRRNVQAICRGFFDRHATQPLQIAERLGFVKFV